MAKTEQDDDGTIENRVYLFESLAKAFVEKSADDLSAKSPERRARALRALADLAYVSCAVADTQDLSPRAVRRKVLAATKLLEPEATALAESDDEA
ncbi:MAG: hypothetical protein MUC96_27110 [Myxococcaceae bacterium]|jgi:hypothetical protein|nr:hypothetical protein [Myxococcaceae bacterium]